MIRVLVFFLAILGLALALTGIADEPGQVTLTWLGYEIETSMFVAILAVAALLCLLALLWSGFRYLVTRPSALSRYVRERQEERGLEALSKGLIAIGSGDRDNARRYASLARRRLPNEPLTGLLRAQAAQLSGDREEAARIFAAMAEQPGTELLGLRGLFLEASRENETEAAQQFAERAMRRNPDLAWSVNALFELQCRAGDWDGALRTLDVARRQKHVDQGDADRRRAVLLVAQARELEDSDSTRARELAQEAIGLSPDLVPAAAMAGRLLGAQGSVSRANRLLTRAWERNPHPEIALAHAYLIPGESPRDRLKRAKKLVQANTDSDEGPIAIATAAIEARDWDEAREALLPLLDGNPASRICTLMARIEAGETGDEGRVREWLARAVRAPRDPAWTADGFVSDRWEPLSPVTGRLDAFEWKVPLQSLAPASDTGPRLDAAINELAKTDIGPVPPDSQPELPDQDRPERKDETAEVLVIQAKNIAPTPGEEVPPGTAEDGGKPAETAVRTREDENRETATVPEQQEQPKIYIPPRAPDDPGPDAPETEEALSNLDKR